MEFLEVTLRTFKMKVFHNKTVPISEVEKDLRARFEVFLSEYLHNRLDAPIDVRELPWKLYREYEADPQALRRKINSGEVVFTPLRHQWRQFTVNGAISRLRETVSGEMTLSVKDPDTGEVSELLSFDGQQA